MEMAYYQNNREDGFLSWVLPVVLLVTPLWFVGVILLLRKLKGPRRPPSFPYLGPSPVGGQGSGPMHTPAAGSRRPGGLKLNSGKAMTVGGAVMAILFGVAAITGLPAVAAVMGLPLALAAMSPVLGLCAGGLALMGVGSARTRKAKRFRKYLALIGKREKLNVVQLAARLSQPEPGSLGGSVLMTLFWLALLVFSLRFALARPRKGNSPRDGEEKDR